MDWLFGMVRNFLLGWVPGWAWFIVALVVLGWVWRTFGWQGLVGAALAILTLGAYRQGWRDRGSGEPPKVPPADLPTFNSPAEAVKAAERQTGKQHTYAKR